MEPFHHADLQSLKEVVTVGTVVVTAAHATVLEICTLRGTPAL
jgi:hypothetical protein